MSTQGGSQLNRILRTTANLLFEKGEDTASVSNLLQGFVTPSMVKKWYERYHEMHGLSGADNCRREIRRLPMPPIDFNAVKVEALEQLLDNSEEAPDASPEPDW